MRKPSSGFTVASWVTLDAANTLADVQMGNGDDHQLCRLNAAAAARNAGKPVSGLRGWALAVQVRSNHNKACCALANKLVRIAYACLRDHAAYYEARTNRRLARRKAERLSFEMPLLAASA